jgi:hypothetical protein
MLFETEMQDIIKGFHHKISQKWSFFLSQYLKYAVLNMFDAFFACLDVVLAGN